MNNEINRFDSALKESATNFELPFDEDAWILMNQKLDANFPEPKKRKKRFGLLLVASISFLTAGLGYYYFGKNTSVAKSSLNGNNNTLAKSTDRSNINNDLNIVNVSKSLIDKNKNKPKNNNFNQPENEANIIKENDSFNQKNIYKLIDNQFDINLINKKNVDKGIAKSKSIDNVPGNDVLVEVPALGSHTDETKTKELSVGKKDINKIIDFKSDNSNTSYTHITSIQLHKKYLNNYKEAEKVAAKNPQPDLSVYETNPIQLLPVYPEIPLANRWYVGGNIGANISYVTNPRFSDMKFTYNLILGFNITNQVGFQTGISYGNKQFDVRKGKFSYNGPYVLWEKFIKEAHANVNAFEVPILVRYQFSEKPNTGLFCTAGFAVMFYKKEDYTLTLDYGNGIPVYKPYNFGESNTEFTMFNASLGYQFPLNKQFTLIAEQSISLPTTNIGNAGMRMSSTAFQLGMRYNFLKK